MSDPIIVSASPGRDQIEAGIRQAITALGPLIALLAQTPWGVKIGLTGYWAAFVSASGIIATVVAVIYGQIKTRTIAQKAATMAGALPNSVAVTK